MDGQIKDHKEVVKAREVCKAGESPNGILGDLLSDLIDALIWTQMETDTDEAESTGELAQKIKTLNDHLKELGEDDLVIGSLDVEALYPSLDILVCAAIVRKEIEENEMEINILV